MKFIYLLLMLLSTVKAATIKEIHFHSAESPNDVRFDYDFQLLRLALEKTKDEFSEYILVKSPPMNFARAQRFLRNNKLKNFISKQSYHDEFMDKNIAISDFPVDLGVVGYRVCFVNKNKLSDFSLVKSYKDLVPFIHGQGKGWLDVEILRNSQLKVNEFVSYESLFKLVIKGRVDLFCRGINELFSEYDHRNNEPGLMYDKKILISYPLPRFFMSNIENIKLIKRIEKGLLAAFEDGSLLALWNEKYGPSIKRAELKQRVIIKLENPFISNKNFYYFKHLAKFEKHIFGVF